MSANGSEYGFALIEKAPVRDAMAFSKTILAEQVLRDFARGFGNCRAIPAAQTILQAEADKRMTNPLTGELGVGCQHK